MIRACITALTYAVFALVAYWAWRFVPGIDTKFMGGASVGVGALFALIDGLFWKTIDGSNDLTKSSALTSRDAIELKKRLDARTRFLVRRWIFSFLAYLACLFAGIAIMAMPAKHPLPVCVPRMIVAILASTIPAMASLIWARIDTSGIIADINMAQREYEDREKALADIHARPS